VNDKTCFVVYVNAPFMLLIVFPRGCAIHVFIVILLLCVSVDIENRGGCESFDGSWRW